MARSTLARHRSLFSRDPDEGGGGGTGGNGGEGGSTDTGGNGGEGGEGGQGGGGNSGKQFTPITSQEEFDNRLAERIRRVKAQFPNYDQYKADSAELARVKQENESASEKAVREAREEAKAEERKLSAPRLVGAEFRAEAKGVLSDAARDAFLEDADLTKYLKDDGSVDIDKVKAKVKALAPEQPEGGTGKERQRQERRHPDTGQGRRESGGKASVSSSREDYLEKRRKQLGLATT